MHTNLHCALRTYFNVHKGYLHCSSNVIGNSNLVLLLHYFFSTSCPSFNHSFILHHQIKAASLFLFLHSSIYFVLSSLSLFCPILLSSPSIIPLSYLNIAEYRLPPSPPTNLARRILHHPTITARMQW